MNKKLARFKNYIIEALALSFVLGLAANAQIENTDGYMPNQNMQEYFDESNANYNKSIIYVFFNNQPCYQCAAAIEMIEKVYDQNFIDQYNMFIINYQNDQENDFIDTYNLSKPLEVVLVKINDGASFGFEKLENLQDQISDPVSFKDYFVSAVNNFLGN